MTSVHESGHGIMASLVGFVPRYVTNLRDSTSLGRMYWNHGQCAHFKIVHGIATSEERARALVYVAGVAAERVLLGTDARLASIDEEHARAYGRTTSVGEDEEIRNLLSDAETVFADEHVRNATLTVAHRLLRDRVVFGTDIEAIIEGVGLQRREAEVVPITRGQQRRRTAASVIGDAAFIDAASPVYFFK